MVGGGVTGGVNSVEEWWVRTELGWQQFQSPTRNRLEDSLVQSDIRSEMVLRQISMPKVSKASCFSLCLYGLRTKYLYKSCYCYQAQEREAT